MIFYFSLEIDRKLTKQSWIVSARSVIERFQIKQNVPNLKLTLVYASTYLGQLFFVLLSWALTHAYKKDLDGSRGFLASLYL